MPKSPRTLIFEFQEIVSEVYGIELTLEEAEEASWNLMEAFALLVEIDMDQKKKKRIDE